MSFSDRLPSVNDTYFQHKVLTKVHGKPTYESLQTLQTQVKANASSVPSTLGGGLYGHLGSILSPAIYATLPNSVPWITPTHPGPFAPPAAGTAAQIEAAREVWRALTQSYAIYQATAQALVAQIVEAVDPIYLEALRNRHTGQYSSDTRHVLQHLFATYAKITPQEVTEKFQATANMYYDISQPVDMIFNAIENLVELAEYANSPMTSQQMIDMAHVPLGKQPIFLNDIRAWTRRPLIERTWDNMKLHFREAQIDLRTATTAADVYHQQPAFHGANAATTMADLVNQGLLQIMPHAAEPFSPPTADVANAAIQSPASARAPDLAALQAQLQANETRMQEMMELLRIAGNPSTHAPTRPARDARDGGARTSNNARGAGRTNRGRGPRLYCWSHGHCAHASNTCNTRLPGHQVDATFANMMDGKTTNCYWLPN